MVPVSDLKFTFLHPDVVNIIHRRFVDKTAATIFSRNGTGGLIPSVVFYGGGIMFRVKNFFFRICI